MNINESYSNMAHHIDHDEGISRFGFKFRTVADNTDFEARPRGQGGWSRGAGLCFAKPQWNSHFVLLLGVEAECPRDDDIDRISTTYRQP